MIVSVEMPLIGRGRALTNAEGYLEVGLLLNFGPKPDFRRKVFDNARKTITWAQNK
jgi:hypothetical protein